ncbi:MAG: hypothetical protein ABID87_05180 [Chloroflexota bacterium]
MFLFFLFIALVLLIAGGAGLFVVNTTYIAGHTEWIMGNITSGVFTVLGLAIIVFLTLFSSEIE